MRRTIPDEAIHDADPEQLLYCFYPFVRKVALRYHSLLALTGAIDMEDLIQAGCIGLIYAQQHYDSEAGASFMTYAFNHVRRHMQEAMGCSRGEMKLTCSLDEPISADDPDSETLLDTIPDPDAIDPPEYFAEEADRLEVIHEVRAAVSRLDNDKQREVVTRYYLNGESTASISLDMGIKRNGISGVRQQALRKLKHDYRLRRFAVPRFHVGVREFQTTFTSEPEAIILWKEAHDLL